MHFASTGKAIQIPRGSPQAAALKEFKALFKLMSRRPTLCKDLIRGFPAYIGYSDACKHGAGGVWLAAGKNLHPVVWRIMFPPEISSKVITSENPTVAKGGTGTITINDLEMAAMVFQFLILEHLVDLKHEHIASWCDNMSTVAWTRTMSSKKSAVGQRLARFLSMRITASQSSALIPFHIAGKWNKMADLASRTFDSRGGADNYEIMDDGEFLTLFHQKFPLNSQDASWKMLRLRDSITMLVFSVLLGKQQPPESWLRLKEHAVDIGRSGANISRPSELQWTRFSKGSPEQTKLISSTVLPCAYERDVQDKEIKSALDQCRKGYAPLERPSSWPTSPTHCMTPQAAKSTPRS